MISKPPTPKVEGDQDIVDTNYINVIEILKDLTQGQRKLLKVGEGPTEIWTDYTTNQLSKNMQ